MTRFKSVIFEGVDRLTRSQKRFVFLLVDMVLAPLALFLTCALLYNSVLPMGVLSRVWHVLPLLAVLTGVASVALGIHRIKLKSFESLAILKTGLLALVVTLGFAVLSDVTGANLPGAAVILFGLVFFLLSVATRVAMLHVLLWVLRQGQARCRVLIYGAGTTGVQLAAALGAHGSIVPVAFIDDNTALQGMTVGGLRVYRPKDVSQIVHERDIDRVLLAMPSLSAPKQVQIARRLQRKGLDVHTLPSFAQMIGQEALTDNLTRIVPGRFLGRDQIDTALPEGNEAYFGRSILITGAGGSIGSELCRQLLAYRPRRLVLFEVSEIALYTIDKEMRALIDEGVGDVQVEVVPVLGSVTDSRIVRAVMADQAVEVVFHAAAYKHVPLVEANPLAGLANNVLGTRTLADAANEAGVARFILVSTDKAVRPTNIMGASKRLAELVVQDIAKRSHDTVFSMVRFGNVLGSSGSVIPLFKEQIARGGPITLTHEDVTRFFMTITEASRLVLLAGSYSQRGSARGGDVFVLDMGKPVRIRELAVQMVEAAGYTVRDGENPDGDIEIVTIGLRPGEKLHEELLIGEGLLTTPHPKILRAREKSLSELEMASALRSLRTAVAAGDGNAARRVVQVWVEGYVPPGTEAQPIPAEAPDAFQDGGVVPVPQRP